MKPTFDIYIPDSDRQTEIDIESYITCSGGIISGTGYALNYFNVFGYASQNLLPFLIKKCKENGWYFNEYPPEIQTEINSEYDDYL